MKWTREQLHAKGYRPDGAGRMVKAASSPVTDDTPKPKEKLNRVEAKWLWELRERHPSAVVIPQFRIRLTPFASEAVPVHYTADFAVWYRSELGRAGADWWQCVLWEVKDKRRPYHSDELTRPKMARAENPWVSAVMLASWDGEAWEERKLA